MPLDRPVPGRRPRVTPAPNQQPRPSSDDTVPTGLRGGDATSADDVGKAPGGHVWAEFAVIAAAAVTLFLHLRNAFYVSNDDLLQLSVANEHGLSLELLTLNVFGHFGPVNRLGHLAFMHLGGLDLTVGAVAGTALIVVLLLTLQWCCHELRLSPVRRLLVLAGTGFTAAILDTGVWLDAALHILPALIATYAVVGAHLRGINTGAARWHVLSVAFFTAGLCTQVRPALALPLVVLADVLLVAAGRPWRRRLELVRSVAAPLVAMAVIGTGAAVLLKVFYVAEGGQGPGLSVVARTIWSTFTSALVPALVGWLPDAIPSFPVQLLSAALTFGVAALLVLRRRRNAGPLLFGGLVFLLYYGLMVVSPLLNPDTITANVLRMYNLVYVIIPVVIALAHVRLSTAEDTWPTEGRGRPRYDRSGWARRLTPVVAVVPVIGVLVVTGNLYADQRQWDRARAGHSYLKNVAAAEADWTRPDTTLLPLYAPEPVAGSWAEELGRHESLLPMLRRGWSPGPMRDRLVVLDDGGLVRPVALREEARGQIPAFGADAAGCLGKGPGTDRMTYSLDRTVSGSPLFLQVTYDLPEHAGPDLRTRALVLGEHGEWSYNSWPVALPAGRNTVLVPVLSTTVPMKDVALSELTPGASLCVSRISVVRPVYADGGDCFDMDRYAVRGARVPCPGEPGRP